MTPTCNEIAKSAFKRYHQQQWSHGEEKGLQIEIEAAKRFRHLSFFHFRLRIRLNQKLIFNFMQAFTSMQILTHFEYQKKNLKR